MKNRIIKKTTAGLLAALLLAGAVPAPVKADAVMEQKPYLAIGADLNPMEKETVLELLGVTEAQLADYDVVEITNQDEHEYLDSYLDRKVIGTRALSSVSIVEKEAGNGIQVTTKNISYCSKGMYQNALATAGVENADIVVAGPFKISGTAALVGTLKAYEEMTGEVVDPERVEAATNELVVTSELGESLQDKESAEELIAAVKEAVVSQELVKPEEIEKTIDGIAAQMELNLSEKDRAQIAALMEKIGSLDLNIDSLKEQAKNLYDRLGDMKLNLNISEEDMDGFFARLGNWWSGAWAQIKEFFSGLFN